MTKEQPPIAEQLPTPEMYDHGYELAHLANEAYDRKEAADQEIGRQFKDGRFDASSEVAVTHHSETVKFNIYNDAAGELLNPRPTSGWQRVNRKPVEKKDQLSSW